jgi:hypothetical protein
MEAGANEQQKLEMYVNDLSSRDAPEMGLNTAGLHNAILRGRRDIGLS